MDGMVPFFAAYILLCSVSEYLNQRYLLNPYRDIMLAGRENFLYFNDSFEGMREFRLTNMVAGEFRHFSLRVRTLLHKVLLFL